MFDIGFAELVLLGILGLIVLGPQKLPHTIRMIAAYIGHIKRSMNELKHELEQEVDAEAMRQRIHQEVEQSGLQQIKEDIENTIEDVSQVNNTSLQESSSPASETNNNSPQSLEALSKNE